jgi:hypothetical protein
MGSHMFRRSYREELHKRDLHSQKCTKNVKNIIGFNDFLKFMLIFRFMGDHVEKDKNWDNINDK